MEFNLADLFEGVVDRERTAEALVCGSRRLTYAELDERANRLAQVLAARGIGRDDFVGLHLTNGTEYLEAMLACFKLRAVPVNVNYRYVEAELRHLYSDAGLVGLVHHRAFADAVRSSLDAMPEQRVVLEVDDGSGADPVASALDYEVALAGSTPDRPEVERSGDDLYCVYTGGTTGLPKGVLWRQEDIFFAGMRGGDPTGFAPPAVQPGDVVDRIDGPGLVALAAPPLMHASAHWLAFSILLSAGRLVLVDGGRFDADMVWDLVASEQVHVLVIVGDAMAGPLLDRLDERRAAGRPPDTGSLLAVGSGGAVLSPVAKRRFADLLPDTLIADQFGSSETGQVGGRPAADSPHGSPRLHVDEVTSVLDDDLRPVVPGSGTLGRLARSGRVPLRYHGHPEASAATFVEVDGRRWALPGDLATVSSSGEVEVLGRASLCINTGGEKVFPDEVEAALKELPGVQDAVVVGVPDERWGQQVTAVVAALGPTPPTTEEIRASLHGRLAPYKIPRRTVVVDRLHRSPSGKADYRWALEVATLRAEVAAP